ncbi:transcriptional regulator [Lampropedia aestuarii]|nr:YdaS family helix-turn-helix protein [Lampropedia aestuarii]
MTTNLPAIQKAIDLAGVEALASVLGLSIQAIYHYRSGARKIREAQVFIELEKLSNGVVTCEDMASGVDWAYLRKSRPELTQEPTNA